MPQKKFQKRIEDFVCSHCGAAVVGTGYTNHCPKCLWSKHVDIHPGDRASSCVGVMEPVGIEGIVDKYRIVHRCIMCGYIHRNNVVSEDDMEEVLRLAGKLSSGMA